MNKIIKCASLFLMLALNTANLFADIGSRGRYSDFSDSGSKLDDLFMPIGAIILIVIGGFFIYGYVAGGENKDKTDKKWGRWGCVSLIVGIGSLVLLIRSCAS